MNTTQIPALYLCICLSVTVLRLQRPEVRIPPAAPWAASFWVLLFLFRMKLCEMLQGRIRTACARRLRPGGQKQSCGLFLRRGSANPPGRTKQKRSLPMSAALFCFPYTIRRSRWSIGTSTCSLRSAPSEIARWPFFCIFPQWSQASAPGPLYSSVKVPSG